MLVGREQFDEVVRRLSNYDTLSLDTETTGLRPYHGSVLFSIIIGSPNDNYYFNFKDYGTGCLTEEHKGKLQRELFDYEYRLWYMHNAKYDMAILKNDHLKIYGYLWCTMTMARIERNDHMQYGLDACAKRIGFSKDKTVEEYIDEHKLFTYETFKGKKIKKKNKHFDQVPLDIIRPYAERDAEVTHLLGQSQWKSIATQTIELPALMGITTMEQRLLKVCYDMEQVGVKINREFCERAAKHEEDEYEFNKDVYEAATRATYTGSWQSFSQVFLSDKDRWEYGAPTKVKGEVNPTFDSDVIKKFKNPLAQTVLSIREKKSKMDFYNGYLYHADSDDIIHPNWNQSGTKSGRFSSSGPNFQNLEKSRDKSSLKQEFVVRRAVVPRPGYTFIMPDYDQVEYRLMMDYAAAKVGYATELVKKILGGLDVHTATMQVVQGVLTSFTRDQAKTVNFGILYGQGVGALADSLNVGFNEAKKIRNSVLRAAPEIGDLINAIKYTCINRKFIRTWAGRKLHLSDPNFAYKMPNHLIQGGAADVTKFAMVEIAGYLKDKEARMVMCVHDELVVEVHDSELGYVPQKIKEIMEGTYKPKYIPLTVGMSWSKISLADKTEGMPPFEEAGNIIQREQGHTISKGSA